MKANILLDYENKWVALDKKRTKVLYASQTLDNLYKQLSKSKNRDVILHFVPPFNTYLSP